MAIDLTEVVRGDAVVQMLDKIFYIAVAATAGIILLQHLPVFAGPIGLGHFRILNQVAGGVIHRYGDPFNAIRRFDAIAIAPVIFGVLHIVVDNKFIYRSDDIEITFPGNIIRLQYGNSFWCAITQGGLPRESLPGDGWRCAVHATGES